MLCWEVASNSVFPTTRARHSSADISQYGSLIAVPVSSSTRSGLYARVCSRTRSERSGILRMGIDDHDTRVKLTACDGPVLEYTVEERGDRTRFAGAGRSQHRAMEAEHLVYVRPADRRLGSDIGSELDKRIGTLLPLTFGGAVQHLGLFPGQQIGRPDGEAGRP